MGTLNPKHLGSSLDDFLAEEGILEAVEAAAIKHVLARHLTTAMAELGLSKTEMARRMGTSRSALDRLLDPRQTSLTLMTLGRAARVLGKRLRIEIVDAEPSTR